MGLHWIQDLPAAEGVEIAETHIGRYHGCDTTNSKARMVCYAFRRDPLRRRLPKADTGIQRRRKLYRLWVTTALYSVREEILSLENAHQKKPEAQSCTSSEG